MAKMNLLASYAQNARSLLAGGLALVGSAANAQSHYPGIRYYGGKPDQKAQKEILLFTATGREKANSYYKTGTYILAGAEITPFGPHTKMRGEYICYFTSKNLSHNSPVSRFHGEAPSPSTNIRLMMGVTTASAAKMNFNMFIGAETYNARNLSVLAPNFIARAEAEVALSSKQNNLQAFFSTYAECTIYSESFGRAFLPDRPDAFSTGIRLSVGLVR